MPALFEISAEYAVEFLNELLATDPDAINVMFAHRVHCNEALADHPTVQVRGYKLEGDDVSLPNVGITGLLNGMFGVNEVGYGPITVEYDTDTMRINAFKYNPESHLKEGDKLP